MVMLSSLLFGWSGPLAAAVETLLLDVRLNGQAVGMIGEFVLLDGKLFAQRSELRELGLKIADRVPADADNRIALSTLPGVAYHLDMAAQTIALTVGDERIVPTLLLPDGVAQIGGAPQAGGIPQPGAKLQSGTGATLDYDLTASAAGGRVFGAGLLDLRLFSPWGVANTSMLTDVGGHGATSVTRLDTSYTLSDPASLRRLQLGDFVSGSLAWTRPVRLAGAQVSLDFGLRPDLITFPLPSVSGSAAVPSTVDVLINGTRLFSREIAAGPFEIPQLPVVTGTGTVSTTVTNALGRQVATTLPFYASSALLTPGLQMFSAQAGAVRRNFGLRSNDYRSIAASGTYRRGLSNVVTVEATVEATRNFAMAGAGTAVNVANLAVVNASAAFSRSESRLGKQLSVGVQRSSDPLSFSASVAVADRRFRDLAAVTGDPVPRLRVSTSVGLTLGDYGSIGAAYIGINRDAALVHDVVIGPPGLTNDSVGFEAVDGDLLYLQPPQKAHVVTASYSIQIGRLSLYATGFHDLGGGSSGLLGGLAMPFGPRASAAVNAGIGNDGATVQLQASRTAVEVGDWGYQLSASAGSPAQQFAEARYKASWSLLSAGIGRSGGITTLRAETQGSLSFFDGGVFASNTIQDSFAVVDTDGLANVRVRSENRDVGATNGQGRLLVTDLRSFEVNHLSIEPTDVPIDTTLGTTIRDVRPQDRSGIVVRFPVEISRAALLQLVDSAGVPIALGSTARLTATGTLYPVGHDGQAYIEGLSDRNEVVVEQNDGRPCSVRFDYQSKAGDIPVLGPLPCVARTR